MVVCCKNCVYWENEICMYANLEYPRPKDIEKDFCPKFEVKYRLYYDHMKAQGGLEGYVLKGSISESK